MELHTKETYTEKKKNNQTQSHDVLRNLVLRQAMSVAVVCLTSHRLDTLA